nr:biotin--[acetyl-CoA-carboxylase] ligase [Salsipaludibacter albus]
MLGGVPAGRGPQGGREDGVDQQVAQRLGEVDGVHQAVVFAQVDSTNAEARRRIDAGGGPGLVVAADRQTAGRGRRGRSWDDVAGGNLALTVVVALPRRPTLLPLVAALAVRDVLADRAIATSWKWPNDVRAVVDGRPRKCAGILVETASWSGGTGPRQVGIVGIGVDVDWRGVERSGDAGAWTSLAEVGGTDVDVGDLAVDLVTALHERLAALARDPDLVRRTAADGCDTLGRRVRVEGERRVLVGRARDLTDDGALVLDVDGTEVVVTAGDVVHLRDAP